MKKREDSRDRTGHHKEENTAIGNEITKQAHGNSGHDVAGRVESLVAPWRRSNNRRPTIPREMAQMAGPKMLDVPPIKTWADITDQKVGTSAISNAPTASATIPAAIKRAFGSEAVDHRPRRGLGQDSGDSADGQRDSHSLLVPPISGEVDGEEGPDSRLHVGEKEIEPVQTMERSGGRRPGVCACLVRNELVQGDSCRVWFAQFILREQIWNQSSSFVGRVSRESDLTREGRNKESITCGPGTAAAEL